MDLEFSSAAVIRDFSSTMKDVRAAVARTKDQINPATGGMAHALYEGNWKLVIDLKDEPAALYDLARDLSEQHNLIKEREQAGRVKRMTEEYRRIRSSKRSVPEMERVNQQ
jgi:arylsulfatase A-like enzyme